MYALKTEGKIDVATIYTQEEEVKLRALAGAISTSALNTAIKELKVSRSEFISFVYRQHRKDLKSKVVQVTVEEVKNAD